MVDGRIAVQRHRIAHWRVAAAGLLFAVAMVLALRPATYLVGIVLLFIPYRVLWSRVGVTDALGWLLVPALTLLAALAAFLVLTERGGGAIVRVATLGLALILTIDFYIAASSLKIDRRGRATLMMCALAALLALSAETRLGLLERLHATPFSGPFYPVNFNRAAVLFALVLSGVLAALAAGRPVWRGGGTAPAPAADDGARARARASTGTGDGADGPAGGQAGGRAGVLGMGLGIALATFAILTLSRSESAMLVLLCALPAIAVVVWLPRIAAWMPAAILLLGTLASLFASTLMRDVYDWAQPRFLDGVVAARLDIWERVGRAIVESGARPHGFEATRMIPPPPGLEGIFHPHNGGLQMLLDVGWPGFAAAIVLAALAGRALSRHQPALLVPATCFVIVTLVSHGVWQSWWLSVPPLIAISAMLLPWTDRDGTVARDGTAPV